MLAVLTVVAPSVAMAGSTDGQFADPPSSKRPKFFWNWPGNLVENGELAREVREMSDAGFGGGLVLPLLYGVPSTAPPETYEWGSPSFANHIGAALQAARDEDFTLDLFLGPSWPLASPAVTGNERTIGSQELGLAKTEVVGPTQFAAAPPRRTGERPDDRLVAVTAARVAQDGAPIMLDSTTAIDLTRRVGPDGTVRWDVPAGRWILFAFWQAPTRQVASSYPAAGPHVVDHFSRTAVNAALDYFDKNVLAPQDRRALGAAEQIFTDSYEMQAELLWTHDFLAEFRKRRGYDLTPYLPVVFVPGQHRLGPYYTWCADRTRRCSPPPPVHEFPGDAGKRVRRDYYQTLSELWIDEHLTPLRQWSNRRGLTFSDEPYGLTADVIEGAKAADVPKAEDHWNRTVDFLRTVTSGAHLAGRRKASMELGTAFNKDYMMTLRELKRRADKSFASGVNELVVLGHPYRNAPGTDWPTWQPFSTEFFPAGFSDAWNSANPLWRHMGPLADYLARGQTLLQQGEPVADVAVYRDSYGYMADPFATDDPPEHALTRELSRSGYAYDFVNPTTLLERGTRARDGRLQAGVPEYRGLVVDTDFDRGMNVENHAMDPAVAERLVEVARAGVPIVFVGAFPQRGVSFRDPRAEDAALNRALDRLRRSPSVRVVDNAAAVPGALAALGARVDLAFDAPQNVYSVHRRAGGRDLWFLWNNSEHPARFTGSFAARGGTPQRWDMWTGRVSRRARYRESQGRVHVPIELDPFETTVIAFESGSRLHVVETDAEETGVDDGRLVLRSTTAGVRHAVLSNGARRTVQFPALPAARDLAQWDLRVEGAVPTGEDRHELRLTELADWRAIPELAHTSGTGVYRTVVEVDGDWPAGAYLELGRVEGGAQVRVNGRRAHPASVPPARIPVGALLRRGRNVIEIELTTTLKNRLVELGVNTPGFARFRVRSETQPYGLLGPVRLVPYAERTVGRR